MTEMPQQYSNHTRWFPLFHFFAFPLTLLYTFYAIYLAVTAPTAQSVFFTLFVVAVLASMLAARTMAVKVQDRVIRLEETLRMHRILPSTMHGQIVQLDPSHLVALRFASDEELADLVRRTLAGELKDRKSIKLAIKKWRADWMRA